MLIGRKFSYVEYNFHTKIMFGGIFFGKTERRNKILNENV